MARYRRALAIAALAVAISVMLACIVVLFEGPRSAVARTALQILLYVRGGFRLERGDVAFGARRVVVTGIEIADASGEPVFGARRIAIDYDPHGLFGGGDRAFGVSRIAVERPRLRLVHLTSGDYNITPLFGPAQSPSSNAPPPQPRGGAVHLIVAVTEGHIDFENPTAFDRQGRAFALDGIQASASIAQGARSIGAASGRYIAGRIAIPVHATLVEDDVARYAQIRVKARNAPAAPIVDYLVSTPGFVVEDGLADAELRAYALEYDPRVGPQWQWSGSALVRSGTIRFTPFAAPVRDIEGRLRFAGGVLALDGMHGFASGIPIFGSGGMRFFDGFRFELAADAAGPLDRARTLFAFSKRQPVHGRILAHVRLDGPLDGMDVSGTFSCPGVATFAGIPVHDVTGSFFYNSGHLTFQHVAGDYAAGRINADGDVALDQAIPTGVFIVAGRVPSSQVPVVAGMIHDGNAETVATIELTQSSLRGAGYAQVRDARTSVRADYNVERSAFVIGPAMARWPDGELALAAIVDRLRPGRILGAELVARHATIRIANSVVRMPGLFNDAAIRSPAIGGVLDGTAVIRPGFDLGNAPLSGLHATSQRSAIDLRAGGVRLAATDVGDVRLVADGDGSRFAIRRAAIHGRDLALDAHGVADFAPVRGSYAAALGGVAEADVSSLPLGVAANGRAAVRFDALLDGDRWAVAVRSQRSNLSVAGVPIAAVAGIAARSDRRTFLVGTADAAGGTVAVAGSNSTAPHAQDAIGLWARGIHVQDFVGAGLPLAGGQAVVMGDVQLHDTMPAFNGAVALDGSSVQGIPLAGELDVRYENTDLAATGNVDVAGSRAALVGTARGLGLGASPAAAALDFRASVREGDLGQLAGRFVPASMPLTGSVSGNVNINGTLGSPAISGTLSTERGTLRGVAFDNLTSDFELRKSAVSFANGRVLVGSSAFSFGGEAAPGNVQLQAASRAVDLADFNDFFDGYDTLEGTGKGNIRVGLSPGRARATGTLDFAAMQIAGVPLGTVHAALGSRSDSLLADVTQDSVIGSSSLHGAVRVANTNSLLPQLSTARYDISGNVRGVDLAVVAPLVHQENAGVSGKLDATGAISGSLRHPAAHANFALRDGRVHAVQISSASGRVDSNGIVTRLSGLRASAPFADAFGDATFGPGGRIAGSGRIDASDLNTIAALAKRPGELTGSAAATFQVSGTTKRPLVSAQVRAGSGTARGIAFDGLTGSASFAPGELVVRDTEMLLAHRRGKLSFAGTLPISLAPFGLGPARKPVAVRVDAAAIDLAALDPLLAKDEAAGGILNAQFLVTGSAGAPELAGSAALRGGSLTLGSQEISGVDGDVALAHDTLTLAKLHGSIGSGTFDARGAAHVVPAADMLSVAGLSYSSHVTLHRATIDVPRWVSGTLDGDLSFTKSGSTPSLSGTLTLSNGTIPTSAIIALASGFGQTSEPTAQTAVPGVPRLKPGEMAAYGGPLYPPGSHLITGEVPQVQQAALFSLPSIDLALKTTAQNVRVRGGALDLTGGGALAIGGNVGSPTLEGTLSAKRGQVSYFDTVFRLQRGAVTFSADQGVLPDVDVQAVTNASGQRITVAVTGRLDHLNTDLTSDSQQSREEIIATLLHGGAIESTINDPSLAQGQLASLAQDYFNAELQRSVLFPFESALAESLNLQEFSFVFDERGNLNVELRKSVSENVSALYRSSLYAQPPSQAYGIAYSLNDFAALEFLQTQASSGLQTYSFDMRLAFH